jgi:hypothetical protein
MLERFSNVLVWGSTGLLLLGLFWLAIALANGAGLLPGMVSVGAAMLCLVTYSFRYIVRG